MKSKKKTVKIHITRKYTCTRRRNKDNKKIWVVLEDGRKFYRIFSIRSAAIKYFETLKTIYAEMLIQDLSKNLYTTISYTKLEIKSRGLKESLQNFDGGVAEYSDKFFDENAYISSFSVEKIEEKKDPLDFSFVDKMFPEQRPLITPLKIKVPVQSKVKINKTIISNEHGIVVYQEDLNLSYFVEGDEFYENREEYVEENK